jgi:hypothetical protein
MLTLDELKNKILEEGYDECLICDILEISVEELLEAFDYKLILNREKFDDDES